MPRTCEAVRRDGRPCETRIVGNSSFCFGHDPALREKRLAASRKGGENKATSRRLSKLMPARLLPVFEQLEAALGEVHAGGLDPKAAGAMAALARAMAAVLAAGELEQRLRALEERAS